jgi:hypothetical protein
MTFYLLFECNNDYDYDDGDNDYINKSVSFVFLTMAVF